MRILGLDYGSKTVGVAISDPLGITAQGVEIIRRTSENKLRKTLARIEALIEEYEVEEIILGYPKNMNDTLGPRVQATEEFKAMLERRTGLPVKLWDERLTTVAADKIMMETGVRRENRKEYVDMIAAKLILQGYLDFVAFNKSGETGESMDKICLTSEDGEAIELFAVEKTKINGVEYLLASDCPEGDGDCYILKDLSDADSSEAVYEFVEDEEEINAVFGIFEELLEDIDLM
ncbi:putative Holliday junction resolvase [Lachnospiraceae bacterium TWA4]|nr:putative Holliday junction resolvase [Lachnospiraceae bacterium TWA4]